MTALKEAQEEPMSEEKPLHVVELRSENVKRVRAATIRPDGGLVVIGGRNGQGKSSLLDSLEMALGGGKTIPADPVRHGARKARVVVDLGELVVERTFSAKGTQLVVRNADGEPQASPQKMLDKLYSKVSLDPLAFTRMDPKQQDATLKEVLGLDFSKIDAERQQLYDARRELNREAKRLEAQLDAMPSLAGVPDKEESVSALVEEIDRCNEVKAANDRKRGELNDANDDLVDLDEKRSDLQGEIEELEAELAQKRQALAELEQERTKAAESREKLAAEVEALEDPDVSELRERIEKAEETNVKVRQKRHRAELEAELRQREQASEKATAKIEALDAEKARQLEQAEFPVEGLGFDDTGPTLGGVPLEQASQAEKLRITVAIGAALNARVKIALVREASLLDEESMRLLAEEAARHDLQLWLERVSADGAGCSVLIEDGEVVEGATAAAE